MASTVKVDILEWDDVAIWKWNVKDDICGICQEPFDACAPNCKFPGDECPPCWGQCKHVFHMQCIMKWLESSRDDIPSCPMCRQAWEFAADEAGSVAQVVDTTFPGDAPSADEAGMEEEADAEPSEGSLGTAMLSLDGHGDMGSHMSASSAFSAVAGSDASTEW